MAISRMQEPRQLYGLGSLVKSIGKTIKKVVKSPIGKAAILGIGAFGLPGGAFGMKGFMPTNLRSLSGIGKAIFGGATANPLAAGYKGMAPSKGIFGAAKKFLGSTAGQVGVGAALSALAASGMDQEEIAEIENDPEKLRMYLKDYYSKTNPDASGAEIEEFVRINSATGGRIGFADGKNMKMAMSDDANERLLEKIYEDLLDEGFSPEEAAKKAREEFERQAIAIGGRVGLMGGAMPTGIMRANKAGTIERDYRETGGFVPVGIKEKADDVPAMLSKNEFVMTADAVRGMGDGNIEKGAQRLYDQMKQAEKRVV